MPSQNIALFTAFLIVVSLAFGGLSHSLLPHQHSHVESVTSTMHSALRHEEKKFIDLPVFLTVLSIAVVTFVVTGLAQTQIALMGLVIRAQSSDSIGLRRGIVAYRRFG